MATNRISLKWKLIGLPVSAVLLLSIAFILTTFLILSKRFEAQAAEEVRSRSKAIDHLLRTSLERNATAAESEARNPVFANALTNTDARSTAEESARLTARDSGFDFVTLYNDQGLPVASSQPVKDAQAPQLSIPSVQHGLSGKKGSGFEQDAGDRFLMVGVAPILSSGRVIGTIVVGNVVQSETFVDQVKSIFDVECTLFNRDTRAVTTLVRDGRRLIGTKMDNPEVLKTVLSEGRHFEKRNMISGKSYDTAYWPLHDVDERVVGMGFIGRDREEVRAAYMNLFGLLAIIIAIGATTVAIASSLVAGGIGKLLHRLAESMKSGSHEVTSASNQITDASNSLAKSSSEQAASLEESSASLAEISSMVQRNAENASQAQAIGQHTREAAEQGAAHMNEMTAAMNAIKSSSDDIAKIIKTIDEIAFQTNILALNAAVEAARAGEAGAGFAVVADEVRNLAQRAATAAKETSTQISSAITRTSEGVAISDKVALSLQQIVEAARKLDTLITEVTTASREQSQGLEQLNKSVGLMETTTQQNAAGAEETASAAAELNAQASVLMDAVTDLFVFVDGSKLAHKELSDLQDDVPHFARAEKPARDEHHPLAG